MDVLFEKPEDRLAGSFIGGQVPLPSLDVDGRTVALETLRTFVSLLDFTRTGPSRTTPNGARPPGSIYRIPRESIFPEQPDEPVNLKMPAIGTIPNEGVEETYALGPPEYLECTKDKYGLGTAVVQIGEYTEELNFEIWAESPAQRRSVIVGMQDAFTCCEQSGTLRLKLPDYFDSVATFELRGTKRIDDFDGVRNRRRAHMRVGLTVPRLRLARYTLFKPSVQLIVTEVQLTVEVESTVT